MTARDVIARALALSEAATDGPWAFGIAPHPDSKETPAEWLTNGLRGEHPLYAAWAEKRPAGYEDVSYVVPAVTGDGPNAGNNATFIAAARTLLPAFAKALGDVLTVADTYDDSPRCSEMATDLHAAITAALPEVTP